MDQPLPSGWISTIEHNLPYYRCLPDDQQELLHGLVQVFLDEKPFEACAGIVLTDRRRVTIAGYACLLLLGRETDLYPKLRTILVYPYTYIAPAKQHRPDGTVSEGIQVRSGESWSFGNVVLSWSDVLHDISHPQSGRNVVLHEFAHQLDMESGGAPGAPALPDNSMYPEWARVMEREYAALVAAVEAGRPTAIDRYGATSPAEFFAVLTEHFFTKPVELKVLHPELYRQLMHCYGQDPAYLLRESRSDRLA